MFRVPRKSKRNNQSFSSRLNTNFDNKFGDGKNEINKLHGKKNDQESSQQHRHKPTQRHFHQHSQKNIQDFFNNVMLNLHMIKVIFI